MTTWHATAQELTSYRAGAAGPLLAASLDAHLIACATCRSRLAAVDLPGSSSASEQRWQAILAELDGKEYAETRAGLSPLVRLGASTRPLAAALAVAVVFVLVLPLLTSLTRESSVSTALLALAPLAPMIGVAFAYRRETDPAGEISLAAPLAGIRLVVRRALFVAAFAVPIGVGVGLAVDVPVSTALSWLLPGFALAATVLFAATTRVDPTILTAVLGTGWALAVLIGGQRDGVAVVAGLIEGIPVQTTSLVIAVIAVMLVVLRRDRIAYRRNL